MNGFIKYHLLNADLVIKTRNKLLYMPISLHKLDLYWNYFVSDILFSICVKRSSGEKS